MNSPLPPRTSPCVGRCELDRLRKLCLGCLRTMREIERWPVMDQAERDRVWAALPDRRIAEERLMGRML